MRAEQGCIVAERSSRNQLCQCGSGKKYKRCCRSLGFSHRSAPPLLLGQRACGTDRVTLASKVPPRDATPTVRSSSVSVARWNEVVFDAPLGDGGRLHVVLLYSDAGLRSDSLTPGEIVPLDLPDVRFSGPAAIVSVRPSVEAGHADGHVLRVVRFRGDDDLGRPLHGDWQPPPEAIARWQSRRRHIVLKLDNPDGSWCDVELLRTVDWIEEAGARVSGVVFLDLAEVGVRGWGKILAIKPCGVPKIGPGEMVTGTFRHSHGRIGELAVESQTEPIGVTPNHLIWSVDRQDWVRVSELYPGEMLTTEQGLTRVVSYTLTDVVEPVYNIEVDADHCYRVGEQGILVHNASCEVNSIRMAPPIPATLSFAAYNSNPNVLAQGYSTAALGAWNDPRGRGDYKYVTVIIVEGCNLNKCSYNRFVAGTYSSPLPQAISGITGIQNVMPLPFTTLTTGNHGKGYTQGGRATSSDYPDGPDRFLGGLVFAKPPDEAGIPDGPGAVGLTSCAVPFNYHVNFLLRIRDGMTDVKCVYYDVIIDVDRAPGAATTPPRLINWTVRDGPCT